MHSIVILLKPLLQQEIVARVPALLSSWNASMIILKKTIHILLLAISSKIRKFSGWECDKIKKRILCGLVFKMPQSFSSKLYHIAFHIEVPFIHNVEK